MLLPLAKFSAPTLAPRVLDVSPEPAPLPIGIRPSMSGTLNVDDPFPAPNVVLTAENKAEYVVLLTACPLHSKYRFVESSDFVG